MAGEVEISALVDLLKNVDLIVKESSDFVRPEKQREFELRSLTSIDELARQTATNIYKHILKLITETKACCNGGWQTAKPGWMQLLKQAETLIRTSELIMPASSENLQANLMWMIAQGTENNLDLLKKLPSPSPSTPDDIRILIDKLEEQTGKSEDLPHIVLKQGEEAYRIHKQEWDREYAGQYIAIHQGKVIEADTSKLKLTETLLQRQKEDGPFRACIIHVGAPLREIKGPTTRSVKW